jgi:hypothetical protein
MLFDTWHVVSSCPGVRPVLAATDTGQFPVQVSEDDLWLQGDGDLGLRLERILSRSLLTAPAGIAIGADSPLITRRHLEAALGALDRHESILGRCPDGGFYLLGVRHCPSGLLSAIPWSTPYTAAATISALEEHGYSVAEVESLFDVDTPDDLHVLAARLEENPLLAPATRAWFSGQFAAGVIERT